MNAPPPPVSPRAHALWLAAGAAALVAASLATVDGDAVRLAGWRLPATCQLRRFAGVDCAACGLTRSWVALLDGEPGAALALNPIGPPLLALLVAQTAYRAAVLLAPELETRWGLAARRGWIALAAVLALGAALWLLRLTGLA